MNKFNEYFDRKDFWQVNMVTVYPLEKVGVDKYMSYQIMAAMADFNIYEGRTNTYCYDMYKHICETRKVEPLSIIAFSTFITRNFNYCIKNIRIGKKCRVFKQHGSIYAERNILHRKAGV